MKEDSALQKKISKKIKNFGSEKWKKGDPQQREMAKVMKTMPGAQMYSRDDIASMTEGLDGESSKKKKKKRKEPENFQEQAMQYFEDFIEFAQDSTEAVGEFLVESWRT